MTLLAATRLRAFPLVIGALGLLLGGSLPTAPAAAQSPLVASPPTFTVSVPLGERVSRQITISNTSDTPLTPAVYEALPPRESLPVGASAADASAGSTETPLPHQLVPFDAQIAVAAAQAPDGQTDFLVFLRDQADLSAAYAMRDWNARGWYVYETLTRHAGHSQRALREQLAASGLAFEPLWIVNAVVVRGTVANARALSTRADVALVRANQIASLPPAIESTLPEHSERCSPGQAGDPVCWNIRHIGAERVWRDFGVDGSGVTVASIDTGVSFAHPALAASYRGRRADGSFDHRYNWFDPQGFHPAPIDPQGHGTHTVGTIAGRGDGTPARPSVGVAPGASWIAAQGCEGARCSEADLIAAAQWMLAPTDPDGERPRPDLRPMVINNSWGSTGGDPWYLGYTAAWRAAGIFPVFAAGNATTNRPQACGSIGSPGDYADVLAVGATDDQDRSAGFSLFGPARDGRMKPDFSAPGTFDEGRVGILSASNGTGALYRTLQGTSMAAPHVAGVIALLWSANPALIGDYEATYAILRETAVRLNDTRCGDAPGAPNNVFGYGRVDAYAAVAHARVDVPWLSTSPPPIIPPQGTASLDLMLAADRVPAPGVYRARILVYGAGIGQQPSAVSVTLNVTPITGAATITGQVRDTETLDPLIGQVGVEGALPVTTDSTGSYTLTLRAGEYALVAQAGAYLPSRRVIVAAEGATLRQDVWLTPDQPRLAVATRALTATLSYLEARSIAIPIENTGRRPLLYSVEVPGDRFAARRSDDGQPDAPTFAWVELPASAARLDFVGGLPVQRAPLGFAFPFYGTTFTETQVMADGQIGFGLPPSYPGLQTRCLPSGDVSALLVAPLRMDLDPARGGTVRYGTIANGHIFVVSYEDVVRTGGPPDETYTFQALLHGDGRIVFQYRQIGPVTGAISVGVQRTAQDYQELGCGSALPLQNGLAIELRPQMPASAWLSATQLSSTIPPGSRDTIRLAVGWVRPGVPGTQIGRARIVTNDRRQPIATIPVEVVFAAAPFEQRLAPVFGP